MELSFCYSHHDRSHGHNARQHSSTLKPSEKSPLVGIKIGELFAEAGFPDGVIQIVTGGSSTGKLLSKANLSKLIFTGSVEGGKAVYGAGR